MLKTEFVNVTPEMARAWLEKANPRNRKLSKAIVATYAKEMREGRWKVNGVPILFDEVGDLLDGQHRLAMIAETGVSVMMLLVRGVKREAFDTIDCGKPRTANDALMVEREEYPALLAGAVRMCIGYVEHGTLLHKGKIQNAAITAFIAAHPAIRSDVAFIGELALGAAFQPAVLAALLFLSRNAGGNNDMARRFAEDIKEGVGLERKNPALHLRNYPTTIPDHVRMKRDDYALRVALAFNAYNEGAQMSALRPAASATVSSVKIQPCRDIDTSLDRWARAPLAAVEDEVAEEPAPPPPAPAKKGAGKKGGGQKAAGAAAAAVAAATDGGWTGPGGGRKFIRAADAQMAADEAADLQAELDATAAL